MKGNIASLIGLAVGILENGERAAAAIRQIIKRESPDDLAEFDTRVAATRKPSQDARDAAARENAQSLTDLLDE